MTEVLIIRKDRRDPRLRIKVTEHKKNGWAPNRYEKIIASRDFNQLALLLYDLEAMGYPIDKAVSEYRKLKDDPSLFFLK